VYSLQKGFEQQSLPWTSTNISEAASWYNGYVVGAIYQALPETIVFFRAVNNKAMDTVHPVVRITLDNVVVHDSSSTLSSFLLVEKTWDTYGISVDGIYPPDVYEPETSYTGPVLTFLHGEELWQFVNLTDCSFNPFERLALTER